MEILNENTPTKQNIFFLGKRKKKKKSETKEKFSFSSDWLFAFINKSDVCIVLFSAWEIG